MPQLHAEQIISEAGQAPVKYKNKKLINQCLLIALFVPLKRRFSSQTEGK